MSTVLQLILILLLASGSKCEDNWQMAQAPLTLEHLTEMYEILYAYDVRDGGWEHEFKGVEYNINHVLKELIRARRKDQYDPDIIKDDLTPDYLQYALRLVRWSKLKPSAAFPYIPADISLAITDHCAFTQCSSARLSAEDLAEIELGQFCHDLDHESAREETLNNLPDRMAKTSKYLVRAAAIGATELDFDLIATFEDRIQYLRDRFEVHPRVEPVADEVVT